MTETKETTKILFSFLLIALLFQNMAGKTGEDVGTLWRDETLSGGLALGQSVVGDIAGFKAKGETKPRMENGSIGKVALHAVTGGIYSAATGASPISGIIGGATSEIVTGLMESGSGLNGPPSDTPLTKEQARINADKRINLGKKIKATTKLLSATATLLAGGSAEDITTATNVGESAVKHNRRLHPSEEQILAEVQKGKTPEQQRKFELAAKFMVRASAGTLRNDPQKIPLTQDEIEGSKYVKEQQILRSTAQKRKVQFAPLQTMEEMKLAEGLGGNPSKYTVRTFDYDLGDWISDSFSSNPYVDEGLYRFERAEEVLIGTTGTLALKGASTIVGTMPFGLGDETAKTLDSASLHLRDHTLSNAFGLIEPDYIPTEGAIVQSSFKEKVDSSYVSEHIGSILTLGSMGVGSTIKAGTKLAKIVPKAFKRNKQNSAIDAINKLENNIPTDSSSLYGTKSSVRIGISKIDRAIKQRNGGGEIVKGENFVVSSSEVGSDVKKVVSVKSTKSTSIKSNSSVSGARYQSGVASGGDSLAVVKEGDKWFRGTEANAAKIPKQIAEKMKGMEFSNFDQFRQKFWKLVADDPVLSKNFSPGDLVRMKSQGRSPRVLDSQRYGGRSAYEIHHSTPINQGGAVYDIDNLVIVTPKYHHAILDPKYHGGK